MAIKHLPAPKEDEAEEDFIARCMSELMEEKHEPGTARQLCSIAWRGNEDHPADARLISPPPLNPDIPDRLSRLFDQALRISHDPVDAAFLAGVSYLNSAWTIERIEQELRTVGNLDGFLDNSQEGLDAFGEFKSLYRDAYEGERDDNGLRSSRDTAPIVLTYIASSDAAALSSAPIRNDWWSYDRWVREAISWVDSQGARRVTQVAEGTRDGIRALVREAFEIGLDRDWITRALTALDGDGTLRLGLDARRNRTFLRFIDDLDSDIPETRRAKLIERRYNQLLKDRANAIAQTETVEAANAAQMNTFSSAAQEGELSTELYVIEWIARAIRCPRCAAMDGATREITSGRFVSDGSGPKGVETAEMPELHPRGWCFTRLIPRSEARRLPQVVNVLPFFTDRSEMLLAA